LPNAKINIAVLIVEDSADDAALVLRELRKSGFEPVCERVETAAAMKAALHGGTWDIIFSDYLIPGFGGIDALKIAKESGLGLPFIMVSGKVGEETAVEAMKAGASDFVMKDRLGRLGSVVKRELADVAARRGVKQAQIEWKMAFDAVGDAIFIHDTDFRILRANLAYAALGDLSIEQAIGKPYWEVFPKGDGPLPGCRHVTAEGGMAEDRVDCPDGRAYVSRSFAVKDASGRYTYSVHVMQDVTERDRVREAMEKSERHFRKLIEGGSDAFFVIDRAGILLYRSESGKQLTGWDAADVLRKPVMDNVAPESRPAAREAIARALAHPGQVHRVELQMLRKDGTQVEVEALGRDFLDDPDVGGIVITVRDISERKRAEAELRRLNWALRALGQSNSALVHAASEKELFQSICDAIASTGGYPLAWIGLARDDAARSVEVAAVAGPAVGFMNGFAATWADVPDGRGPTGTAIRTGTTQVNNNLAQSYGHLSWVKRALAHGLAGWIALPIRADASVIGALAVCSGEPNAFDQPEANLFEELAADIGYGIAARRIRVAYEAGLVERERTTRELRAAFESLIAVLAATVERRDPYTAGHQRRVAELASAIAHTLGLDPARVEGLHFAATIHDIGKIYVPAEILARPGKLPPAEFELIKSHAQVGYEIVKDVEFPWQVADMIWQHHERLDGSGYPQGLKAEQILLESRILAVADMVEAMSSHRPYRPGLGLDAALAQIRQDAGTKLDPQVVDACERVFREQGFAFGNA